MTQALPRGRPRRRIVMVLENESYPEDPRVRKEAEALLADGHRVTVLAPLREGQPRREVVAGVGVRRYRVPFAAGGAASYLREYAVAHLRLLPRVVGELLRGADVIHLHNPPDTLVVFGLIARTLRRKVVYDHHDLFPELFELKFGRSPLVAVLRFFQRLSFRLADAVIVTNDSQREVALERGGIAPARLTVVRNGPAAATVVADAATRDGPLDDPRLVFVGSLESQDGVLDLPDMLARLLALPGRSGVHLTVVGDGSVRPAIERELADRGLSAHVRFTGRVPLEEVPGLLAEADICVDPAPCNQLNHRSTMIKIGEYLAAGRPVVAYGLDETRNTAGVAAHYARCGDAEHFVELVDSLAERPEARRELATLALARAPELTWERSAAALCRLYAEL